MRDYGKVSPKFWVTGTGKRIREKGTEGAIVALYLMTSPHSNMLGLYFQPLMYIAYETGLGIEGASKGLQCCIDEGFCKYDKATETVWVVSMARYQIADQLKENDKRCIGIQKDFDGLHDNPFKSEFYDMYKSAFHLQLHSPIEAPPKPHRSQEQEQEQEQEQDINNTNVLYADSSSHGLADDHDKQADKPKRPTCPHQEIIALYHELLPASPQIRDWTPARADLLRVRWNEDASRQNLDWWRRFFSYIAESQFLTGRAHANGRKPFMAPLEWILKAENFAKIREGRYHEGEA